MVSIFLSIIMLSGCCSIINGTKQSVGIVSTPTGAAVSIDNSTCGKTPFIKELTRKNNHLVKIELAGYLPFEATLTRGVSGWIWGNIIFGGLIGLVVDAIDGAMYKLTPEQISATLAKESVSYLYKKNTLYVAVVLEADPSWQKIGQLRKVE